MNAFHPLSDKLQNALLRFGAYQSVRSGEVLVREGQHSDTLRVVLSGLLCACRDGGEGTLMVPEDRMIGADRVINPGKARHTIKAMEAGCIWTIRHYHVRRFLTSYPDALHGLLDCLEVQRKRIASGPVASITSMVLT